jgi:excinuclease ABC subunit C
VARFAFDPQRYPTQPGCYLMRDVAGGVLYVGKAKNLRRRLGSYFRARSRDWKARRLAMRVRDIEVILVNNEVESLVLENNLIKRHKPPYNSKLVDDDSGYFYVALTTGDLPRLVPYRRNRINKPLGRDGVARCFGPYVMRRFRDTLLEYVCEAFGVRTCAPLPDRVCLRYHMGRCCGVCEGRVSRLEYAQLVERASDFMSYAHDELIEEMKERMRACAGRLEYERAQRIRDQIRALESTLQQQIVERVVDHDQDVIYVGEQQALVTHLRRGVVQGMSLYDLDESEDAGEAPDRFLLSHYTTDSPDELIVNRLACAEQVERALATANGHPVRITLPHGGVKRELLQLCERNYHYRVEIVSGYRLQIAG